MPTSAAQIVADLARFAELNSVERAAFLEHAAALRTASNDDLGDVLDALVERTSSPDGAGDGPGWDERLLVALFEPLWRRTAPNPHVPIRFNARTIEAIARLYRRLGPACAARHHLLRA